METLLIQFIYISTEEMAAVAEFVKRRGRVAISELAAKSNTFIDLEARASAVMSCLHAQAVELSIFAHVACRSQRCLASTSVPQLWPEVKHDSICGSM